jgi:dihydrofolate reductase
MEKSMIRVILAHDSFWGIGKDGDLPWPKNKDDLKWFKDTTMGGVVVMGKNTWDSLPEKSKPLPGRNNIVVTSSIKDKDGPYHFLTLEQAKTHILSMSKLQNVWIIGGAQLVESCLDITDELLLNDVGGVYDCDTFLPKQKITELFHIGSVEVLSFGIITKWVRR